MAVMATFSCSSLLFLWPYSHFSWLFLHFLARSWPLMTTSGHNGRKIWPPWPLMATFEVMNLPGVFLASRKRRGQQCGQVSGWLVCDQTLSSLPTWHLLPSPFLCPPTLCPSPISRFLSLLLPCSLPSSPCSYPVTLPCPPSPSYLL